MGPFPDLLKQQRGDRWYLPYMADAWVKPVWPALSGRGRRVESLRAGSQAENLNFWDPKRVEYTPNAVYTAFKDIFDPMPSLMASMTPELIVTSSAWDGRSPVWMEGPGMACPEGVMPDADGRAWFHPPKEGEYTFTGPDGATTTVKAVGFPLTQQPGYGYIQKIDFPSR